MSLPGLSRVRCTETNVNQSMPGPGTPGTAAHPYIYAATRAPITIGESELGLFELQLPTGQVGEALLKRVAIPRFLHLGPFSGLTRGTAFCCGGWGNGADVPQDPFNIRVRLRPPEATDLRHTFVFSYFYQLPFGQGLKFLSNAHGPLNQAVRGWKLTGIIHYNTGMPVMVRYPADIANIGAVLINQRPNWVGGFPHRSLVSSDRRLGWMNMANYAVPTQYTFGNAGVYLERQPGAGYFNPGILKDFPLQGEAKTLELRFEFFNMLNQHAMSGFSSAYGATDFGTAYSTQQTSREIQFGMKFLF